MGKMRIGGGLERSFKRYQPKSSVRSSGLLLGWYDNSLIASVMAGYEGHRGWINYLAVDPEFRRKGLGRTMMKAAETYLEQFECPKINLQIRAQNHQVIEFYKSIGFLQEDVINMGKRLIPDLK